ncbi:MAG: helix-turn-helix domain-containing protein [Myxococcales bacterium]
MNKPRLPLHRARRREVGDTPMARDFFAGRYAKVAAATFDAPAAHFDDVDVAFAVGALTFLGRLDDAQTCFDAWRARSVERDARTLAAARFFLGVAHARSGNFARASELLVLRVRERLRTGDAWSTAFAFQGLACQRYFTGRYKAAARHALRALRAAHIAAFPYAKLLATDLRGHALVQLGHGRGGLELLAQAKNHAVQLGLGMNAFAIDCSAVTYSLKFSAEPQALRQLESLLSQAAHDSYSRHTLLTEYAAQLALRGRASAAREALSQADDDVVRGEKRRGKVASLIAHLHVARWTGGSAACAQLLQQASELLDDADVSFRAELLGFEAFVARARAEPARLTRALAGLRALERSHELHWAKAALQQFSAEPYRAQAFAEDQLTPLLRAAVRREEAMLPRLLALGLLGAIPELLGLTPGRRILILVAENALILEDFGDVTLRANPPRWCPALLRSLGSGDVPKEQLVTQLWGLRSYKPERHDPLIRTAIHRLRAFLEPHGDWIRVTPNGYGSSVPVVFVGAGEAEVAELQLAAAEDELSSFQEVPVRPPTPTPMLAAGRAERICDFLSVQPMASVQLIARSLGVSTSTALRELRSLLRSRRIVKTGFARATRYRLVADEAAVAG